METQLDFNRCMWTVTIKAIALKFQFVATPFDSLAFNWMMSATEDYSN